MRDRRLRPYARALIVVFAGCQSSPAPVSELVAMPARPEGQCASLGQVEGTSHGTPQSDTERWSSAEQDLKQRAAARGATHLQLLPGKKGASGYTVEGIAFRCEGEVSYPGASMLGASDPRRLEAHNEPGAGAPVKVRPSVQSLGHMKETPGCLPGQVYPLRTPGTLPTDYGDTPPAAQLWGCDWNIAAAANTPAFPNAAPGQGYAVRHQGAFSAPAIGIYIFQINGGQPFRLTIGGQVVIEGNGNQNGQVELAAGEHPIRLEYLYSAGRQFDFGVQIKPPGGEMQPFSVAQGSPFYAAQGLQYAGAERLGEGWRDLVDVEEHEIRITKQVHFESDSVAIRKDDDSEAVLFAVAKALRENPAIGRLEIQGHTDDQGGASYNLDLSQRRAESVRRWLIDTGVEPHRLVAKGYGQVQPLSGAHGTDRRAENRRVQFVVQTKAAPVAGASP